MVNTLSNDASLIRQAPAWNRVGLIFFCIALILSLTFVLYMDSDLEKQMRHDPDLFVSVVTVVPMFFGFLQITPLYISLGAIVSGFLGGIISALIVSAVYFGVGAWVGYRFRDKVFNSKMHLFRFYSLVFCCAIVMFSILGGIWWYGSS